MTVYDAIDRLWRNHPRWPSTFSQCVCGRDQGRGGGACDLCVKDMLVKHGADLATVDGFINLLGQVRRSESAIAVQVGNVDMEVPR